MSLGFSPRGPRRPTPPHLASLVKSHCFASFSAATGSFTT